MLLAFALLIAATAGGVGAGEFEPAVAQRKTATVIADVVEREHYGNSPLDTQSSAELLEHFLAALDPGREIFSREDVAGFRVYRERFDVALREGELDPVYAIFRVYRARLAERLSLATALLAREWDYSRDEEYRARGGDTPWAGGRSELDETWRKRIKNDLLVLRLSGRDDAEAVQILRRRYAALGARGEALERDDVLRLFVNAYLGSLDPHSEYFLPRRPRRGARNAGALEGIGVQLQSEREHVTIKRVFEGSAADRSGRLYRGDRILGVGEGLDGSFVDIVGWTLDEAVDLIRGPRGSAVRLQVLPRGANPEAPPATVSLVRDRIDLRQLTARKGVLQVGGLRLGVIHVPKFYIDYAEYGRGGVDYPGVGADVARLINELRLEGLDGLLLDLRGNTGGALLEATRLAGLFIDAGPIVQVRHASGQIEVFADPIPAAVYAGPLLVLVDRYSASASEIFAATMQDYRRAVIVGERTYGKGTVQETFDLNDASSGTFGQLALTIAEYFRVTGRSTQLSGIEPDLELPAWPGAGEYGERFEVNPLPPGQMAAADFQPLAARGLLTPTVRALHARRLREDPELQPVLSAASARATVANAAVSLNERQRRDARDRLAAQDRELELVLRAAAKSRSDPEREDAQAEQLWKDLMLAEAARVLADMIAESRSTMQ